MSFAEGDEQDIEVVMLGERRWLVLNTDCMNVIPFALGYGIQWVLTDPPYGIGLQTGVKHEVETSHKPIAGDDVPFDPSCLLEFENVVLWGANNYSSRLPDHGGWLLWDKVTRNGLNLRIAEYELAWTDCVKRTQGFRHLWSGAYRASENGTKYHPAQKPVALMKFCLDAMKVPTGATVFDPYMGSGSVGVACLETGRRYVGVEVDPEYCRIATERLEVLDELRAS